MAESKCEVGYCTAATSFDFALNPAEERHIVVKQLMDEIAPEDMLVNSVKKADFDKHHSERSKLIKLVLPASGEIGR